MTHLQCSIYLAVKYSTKNVFLCKQHGIDENVSTNCIIICANHGYASAADLWRSVSPKYKNVYEINVYYAEMSSGLFLVGT